MTDTAESWAGAAFDEVAARPAVASAFAPTHVVPEAGMAAWAAAGADAAPVARLDPRLAVQLLERQGDWAHVGCANGWSAWVDARRLVDPSPPAGAQGGVATLRLHGNFYTTGDQIEFNGSFSTVVDPGACGFSFIATKDGASPSP